MNILITSVGRRGYLVDYFKEALNGSGQVHASNSSLLTPVVNHTEYFVQTPLINESNYIPFLLDYCKSHYIKMVIPVFDIDLPVLSKNKQKFVDIGVEVIISDERVIRICNDKFKTCDFLRTNGFLVPKTYNSIELTIEAIEQGILSFPLIIKPKIGMGSIGIYVANDFNELTVLYKKTRVAIQNSYLKYTEENDGSNESIIIQEYLSGNEYGLDIINNLKGEYVTTIVKRKYAMRAGETDCAEVINSPQLKDIGQRLSNVLQHIGNLDVDVFEVDGKYYILEMNARFGGGYPFSHMAGVNLPKALIEWVKKGKAEKILFNEQIGVLSHKDIVMQVLKST